LKFTEKEKKREKINFCRKDPRIIAILCNWVLGLEKKGTGRRFTGFCRRRSPAARGKRPGRLSESWRTFWRV
jgi:hypothetical protein